MEIKTAQFVVSNTEVAKCPASLLPEYAFIGRSNVGKSSLINMLCDRKNMAKTSGKPGKTKLINHFIINGNPAKPSEGWYLVDLPGYGYAQVSKDQKEKWNKYIEEYILNRQNLMCMLVLLDSRIPQQKVDLDFMNWLGEHEIPFIMVFTKIDKLSKKKINENLASYKEEMGKHWDELPQCFYTSAEKKEGKKELLTFIGDSNKLFK